MTEHMWARSRDASDGVPAEWHAMLSVVRLLTICGTTLRSPVEMRNDVPRAGEPACDRCFTITANIAVVA